MTRRVELRSVAKVNLDLRVLHKRPDGYHELRTVFQTVSLADKIEIEYRPAKRTRLSIDVTAQGAKLNIPNNLVLRAAEAILDAAKVSAEVHFILRKQIPMGGGLGGGSSNAAAVLLALPVLSGRPLSLETLSQIGLTLGSDVPFFLLGGTALGLDRGTELYGLKDVAPEPMLIVAPGVHVSTAEAYGALQRPHGPSAASTAGQLTSKDLIHKIEAFQAFVRILGDSGSARLAARHAENDFEPVVFRHHPQLQEIRSRLASVSRGVRSAGVPLGAARMSGSGSALFALFESATGRDRARKVLSKEVLLENSRVIPARLLNRAGYRRMWRQQLAGHCNQRLDIWPPQSRYAR